jgi:hypothetical protein
MLHIILESFDQYDSSDSGGCQFVNQGISCLQILIYIFRNSQHLTGIVENYLYYLDWEAALAVNHLLIQDTAIFDSAEKSYEFWHEIMTVV